MNFKVMSKAAFPDWVERLRADYRAVGPRPSEGSQYVFDDIQSADEMDMDYPSSILPPKKVLLPQHETMVRFKTDGSEIEPLIEEQPTVILGVHTCDMHAIALLDRVFSQGYPDQHYLARRENTTLVSIECLRPCSEHSFCKSMGTLTVPDEFDLHLTDLGDDYAVDIGSEKGEALLKGFKDIRDATDEDSRRVNHVLSEKWPRFPYRLEFDVTELPSLLSVSYRSMLWEELGERCLGCGMCTIVCPTCYCFNVADEVDLALENGERFRVWDSCQLDEFAVVAGGHNFRENRAARQRHRFSRKGKYQTDAFGLAGCVGCGRCAQACLVHITPVDTFNELYRRRVAVSRRRQEVLS
jgi:sulfhydrogenase subunit beta (sulfur reductase)